MKYTETKWIAFELGKALLNTRSDTASDTILLLCKSQFMVKKGSKKPTNDELRKMWNSLKRKGFSIEHCKIAVATTALSK